MISARTVTGVLETVVPAESTTFVMISLNQATKDECTSQVLFFGDLQNIYRTLKMTLVPAATGKFLLIGKYGLSQ